MVDKVVVNKSRSEATVYYSDDRMPFIIRTDAKDLVAVLRRMFYTKEASVCITLKAA